MKNPVNLPEVLPETLEELLQLLLQTVVSQRRFKITNENQKHRKVDIFTCVIVNLINGINFKIRQF